MDYTLRTCDQVFLNKINAIIRENIDNEMFGVKDLAFQTGLSHYQLCKRINSLTGKTTVQFIRIQRLENAMTMLKDGNLTVAKIAFKNGFGSAAYFTYVFSGYYKTSPVSIKRGDGYRAIQGKNKSSYFSLLKNKLTFKVPGMDTRWGLFTFLVLLIACYLVLKN